MVPYIGDFAEDATIYHYFNTFDSNDPSASVTISDLIDSDLFVYKDGSVTDIVTDGASVVIDFDSRTGIHKITIDTSVHADYSTGSDYMVSMVGTTVDAGTVTAALFTFSIENRYNAAADDLANGTDGLGALKTLLDDIPTVAEFNARTLVAASYFDPAADTVATVTTVTNQHTLAEINAEVDTALSDIGLDHLVGASVTGTDVVDNSIIAKLVSKSATADWDDFVNTTDSLQAIKDEIGSAGAGLTEAGGDGDHLTEAGGTGDHLTAIPWNSAWDAEVESEVNDALDTAISELGVAAPTATPTVRTAIMLMYMALRNKLVVQTSGTDAIEIYNDAGTKIAAKTITDDGSDYTEAEMA